MESCDRIHTNPQAARSATLGLEIHGFLAWLVSSGTRFRKLAFGMDSNNHCVQFDYGYWKSDWNRGPVAAAQSVCFSRSRIHPGVSARVLRNACVAALPAPD